MIFRRPGPSDDGIGICKSSGGGGNLTDFRRCRGIDSGGSVLVLHQSISDSKSV